MLAVDAGTHLAAIIRILERHIPKTSKSNPSDTPTSMFKSPPRWRPTLVGNGAASPAVSPHSSSLIDYVTEAAGHINVQRAPPEPSSSVEVTNPSTKLSEGPFAGLELPYQTAKANAAHINRTFVCTYLITHPHLDHLSGFAINTASFQHTYRPKCLAALPSTIDAIKEHIFNDVIWPNLSDEDGGVGLVTYMRLAEGGNVALGTGDGKGYIEVCDGLGVKCWSVSHGHCMKRHSHRGSSTGPQAEAAAAQVALGRTTLRSPPSEINLGPVRGQSQPQQAHGHPIDKACVYDSSAFFIRDHASGKEVLIFGDVEPDSLSLSPRTAQVWQEAALKIVAGLLTGIFIECSYDDSQSDETLFGHLCPRHLIAELKVLAANVTALRQQQAPTPTDHRRESSDRKRKRQSNGLTIHLLEPDIRPRRSRGNDVHHLHDNDTDIASTSLSLPNHDSSPMSISTDPPPLDNPLDPDTSPSAQHPPLKDLKIIVIHMKDSLTDGPEIGDVILEQLLEYERAVGLGCKFEISRAGGSIWL